MAFGKLRRRLFGPSEKEKEEEKRKGLKEEISELYEGIRKELAFYYLRLRTDRKVTKEFTKQYEKAGELKGLINFLDEFNNFLRIKFGHITSIKEDRMYGRSRPETLIGHLYVNNHNYQKNYEKEKEFAKKIDEMFRVVEELKHGIDVLWMALDKEIFSVQTLVERDKKIRMWERTTLRKLKKQIKQLGKDFKIEEAEKIREELEKLRGEILVDEKEHKMVYLYDVRLGESTKKLYKMMDGLREEALELKIPEEKFDDIRQELEHYVEELNHLWETDERFAKLCRAKIHEDLGMQITDQREIDRINKIIDELKEEKAGAKL